MGEKNEASVLRLLIHSPTEPPELNDADAYVESEDTEDGDHCNRHDELLEDVHPYNHRQDSTIPQSTDGKGMP